MAEQKIDDELTTLTVRTTADNFKKIDKRAAKAKTDRSSYMLACALVPNEESVDLGSLSGQEMRELYDQVCIIDKLLDDFVEPLTLQSGDEIEGRSDEGKIELGDALLQIYKILKPMYGAEESDDTGIPFGF
jgi:hypothetical protein